MTYPLKPCLEPLTARIAALPVAESGYPVPWFVDWIDGKPEFRAMDPRKWVQAVMWQMCWVCGQRLGSHKTFVLGPMCGINRTSAEPPSHNDCAHWSARNCPFLSNPKMVRDDRGLEGAAEGPGGMMIKRNPGVTLLWTTKRYQVFNDGRGGRLIEIGEPDMVEWYAHGKPATREQVMASIDSGLPILMDVAKKESEHAVNELLKACERLHPLLPRA